MKRKEPTLLTTGRHPVRPTVSPKRRVTTPGLSLLTTGKHPVRPTTPRRRPERKPDKMKYKRVT